MTNYTNNIKKNIFLLFLQSTKNREKSLFTRKRRFNKIK